MLVSSLEHDSGVEGIFEEYVIISGQRPCLNDVSVWFLKARRIETSQHKQLYHSDDYAPILCGRTKLHRLHRDKEQRTITVPFGKQLQIACILSDPTKNHVTWSEVFPPKSSGIWRF